MNRVKSITIRRFKRLVDVTLELGGTTLIIGANNAGKSSALQAVQFAVSLAQSAALIGGVPWSSGTYELSFSQTQLLYCPVSDAMTLGHGGLLAEDANSRVEVEFVMEDGVKSLVTLRKGRNRNLKVRIEGEALGRQLQNLNAPFSVYAPGLAGIPRQEQYMNLGLIRRTVARGDANLALRNVLLHLRQSIRKWSVFHGDMESLFPGLELSVTFDEGQDEGITATVRVDGGPEVPLDAAGTSILQAAQILSYVTLFSPKLLVLDEPDSHLHPDKQRALCKTIVALAEERQFQCILSSHSRHVLDALRGTSSLVWLSKGKAIAAEQTVPTSVLLDLGALDSIDYFADGEIRCVVATEDSDKKYIVALLAANGFPEEETEVVSYSGCGKADAAIVLGQFLQDKAPNLRLVIHRDGDYLPQDQILKFSTRLKAAGVIPFVTPTNDIEGVFINADHLAELNPPLTAAEVALLIEQATEQVAEGSKKAIINQRTQHALAARQDGGGPPNAGQIAVTAFGDYSADPASMRRGDVVIGPLASLIQQASTQNAIVARPTTHLRIPELLAIRDEIWGNGVSAGNPPSPPT